LATGSIFPKEYTGCPKGQLRGDWKG